MLNLYVAISDIRLVGLENIAQLLEIQAPLDDMAALLFSTNLQNTMQMLMNATYLQPDQILAHVSLKMR